MSARTFELTTSLHGPDELLVARLRGREALSAPWRFDLTVVTRDPELERALLGQRATLTLRAGDAERRLHGVVARASADVHLRGIEGHAVRLRLVPAVWTLGLSRRSRIFQEMSVAAIVDDVLGRSGIATRWLGTSGERIRPYCVQHQESDLDFVSRLLAEEGIFWFGESIGEDERLVLADAAPGYVPLAGDPVIPVRTDLGRDRGEHLWAIAWSQQLRPRAVLRTAFDVRRPHVDLRAQVALAAGAVAAGDLHVHDLDWDPVRTGDAAARVELEQARRSAERVEAEGSSVRVHPGARFRPGDAPTPSLDRELAVVAVEHEGWQPVANVAPPKGGSDTPIHVCRIASVPADVAHRPARRARTASHALETATVVGPAGEEIHTDALGRIKIRFPWDVDGPSDDRASCWVRTTGAWSGASYGSVAVPRVGMGVVVGFLSGDPDRPIVLGTAYDGTHPPPFDLPAEKTKSGLRTRSTPGGDGYNELSFDDAIGDERVFLRAERDLAVEVRHDRTTSVGRDDTTRIGGDRHVEVDGDAAYLAHGNQVVTIEKNLMVHVLGRQHIVIDGGDPRGGEAAPAPPPAAAAELARAVSSALERGSATVAARTARVALLAEQMPEDLDDQGAALREQAATIRDAVGGLRGEAEALAAAYDTLVGDGEALGHDAVERVDGLRRQAELIATTARSTRDALSSEVAAARTLAEDGRAEATALVAAAREQAEAARTEADLAARRASLIAQMAGSIVESAGQVVPRFPRSGGQGGGGGGGDNVFSGDATRSVLTVKGGGTIDAPQGLVLKCGGSSIELTAAGVFIKGPIVDVVGTPIKLNC